MQIKDDFDACFSVATTRKERAVVVSPSGELGLTAATALERALAAVGSGPSPLVLDLRNLRLRNSDDAVTLIGAIERARRAGADPRRGAGSGAEALALADVLDLLPRAYASGARRASP